MYVSQHTISKIVATALLGFALVGCGNLSTQDKGTIAGAGVGAVGGALLGGGNAAATVGGAAVGGVVGHEVSKDKD